MLKFSFTNSKLNFLAKHMGLKKAQVVSFDLPAGYTCAKAGICKSFANRETGKLTRVGPVLCYAAKGETFAPSVRRLRWHNFDALSACNRDTSAMVALFVEAIQALKNPKIIRFHSSGDFFCAQYFETWVTLAKLYPDITFFGYTKHLDYALANRPENFKVQYSYGSKDDGRWATLSNPIPTCFIAENDAQYPGIIRVCATHEGAHEDFYAIQAGLTFAIPIH